MSHFHHRPASREGEHAPASSGLIIHWARFYDTLLSLLTLGRRAQLRRASIELAGIQPGARVLEVGCGTGDLALAARAKSGADGVVYGIDPAPEMIAVARDKTARAGLAVDFRPGVVEALAFPDAGFDIVLSSLMMHHLPDELKRRGLAEMARVLKPGGRLLIVDFLRPTTHLELIRIGVLLHGALRVGVQDLPALMHEAGFTEVQTGRMPVGALGFALGRVGG